MLAMPFGLCNSQSTNQRLMDRTLAGLKFDESYVNNCLNLCKSFEQNVRHVRARRTKRG